MPTGYTYKIAEGKINTLTDYMAEAIYAYGIMVNYRDTAVSNRPKFDMNVKVEDFDLSRGAIKYHEERIAELIADARKFMNLDTDGLKKAHDAYVIGEKISQQKSIDKARDDHLNYLQMRTKVRLWSPQTEFLRGLKKFMLEQLETSISGDPNVDSVVKWMTPVETDPEVWKTKKLMRLKEDLRYHQENLEKEKKLEDERRLFLTEFLTEFKFLLQAEQTNP